MFFIFFSFFLFYRIHSHCLKSFIKIGACTKVGNGLPDNVMETRVLCLSHQLEYFVRVLQIISNIKHVEDAT
jgi:hypothetical protein